MIGAYHAVYFDDVGLAVEFCHDLVPYIAPRAAEAVTEDGHPIVWFHVPRRSTSSTQSGCYLLLSSGAIALAKDVGLEVQACGIIARASLPIDAVLVFGDDRVERPLVTEPRRRTPAPALRAPVVRSSLRVPGLMGTPR